MGFVFDGSEGEIEVENINFRELSNKDVCVDMCVGMYVDMCVVWYEKGL